jgi:hypothetical protein
MYYRIQLSGGVPWELPCALGVITLGISFDAYDGILARAPTPSRSQRRGGGAHGGGVPGRALWNLETSFD